MKIKVDYSYFAVENPECIFPWNGKMLGDIEADSISELRRELKDKGYSRYEYHVVICASYDDGHTTYFGYGFSKLEAYNNLVDQL